MKTYEEVSKLESFSERLHYLLIGGTVGAETFGVNRYLNQKFYRTNEWRQFRDKVILRDAGCDLGHLDCPIQGRIYIHHIEPITMDDIVNRNLSKLLNMDNVISCSFETHQAIHYGDESIVEITPIDRTPGDTKLW